MDRVLTSSVYLLTAVLVLVLEFLYSSIHTRRSSTELWFGQNQYKGPSIKDVRTKSKKLIPPVRKMSALAQPPPPPDCGRLLCTGPNKIK